MKILGISGGTKDGSNDAIVKEALMGAKEIGAETEFIHLLDLEIKPCRGCCLCVTGKNGAMQGGSGKCIFTNDDFPWLEDKIYDADGLIFSMPIFEKGIPGIFECLSDRLGPSHNLSRLELSLEIRKANGITDADKIGPDPRAWKKQVATYFNVGGTDWVDRAAADCLLFGLLPGIKTIENIIFDWAKCIIMDDARIARVREAGKTLAKAAMGPEKAEYIGDPGICPHCHSRLLYFGEEPGSVHCLVCGIEGEVVREGGVYSFRFPPEQLVRAHDTPSGRRIHVEQTKMHESTLKDLRSSAAYRQRTAEYAALMKPSLPPSKNNQKG